MLNESIKKSKQEILEECIEAEKKDWKITWKDIIDLSFQKAHDLARQEETEAISRVLIREGISVPIEVQVNAELVAWLISRIHYHEKKMLEFKEEKQKLLKQERLSFAQKLEELMKKQLIIIRSNDHPTMTFRKKDIDELIDSLKGEKK